MKDHSEGGMCIEFNADFKRSRSRIIFGWFTKATIELKDRNEVQKDDPWAEMDHHARGWATSQKRLSELIGARAV